MKSESAKTAGDITGVTEGRKGTMERLTYTVTEVAQLLGISRGSAYTHVRTGDIPSVAIGGRIVVPRRALDALLDIETKAS